MYVISEAEPSVLVYVVIVTLPLPLRCKKTSLRGQTVFHQI